MNNTYAISQMALIKRLNRRLRKEDQIIKKCRQGPSYRNLGMFYRVDEYKNMIIDMRLNFTDIEDLARSLGVIAKHETIDYSS